MPTYTHLVHTARELKNELGTSAFLTIQRSKITTLLRQVSKEPTTRIGKTLANNLTHALFNEGVLVYPSLTQTSTGTVRLYHAGTVLAHLVDTIVHPDRGDDQYLADAITKLNGKGQWAQDLKSA